MICGDLIFVNDIIECTGNLTIILATKTWSSCNKESLSYPHIPEARSGHSMTVVGSSLVMAFGRGLPAAEHCYTNKIFKDVWRYNLGRINAYNTNLICQ